MRLYHLYFITREWKTTHYRSDAEKGTTISGREWTHSKLCYERTPSKVEVIVTDNYELNEWNSDSIDILLESTYEDSFMLDVNDRLLSLPKDFQAYFNPEDDRLYIIGEDHWHLSKCIPLEDDDPLYDLLDDKLP